MYNNFKVEAEHSTAKKTSNVIIFKPAILIQKRRRYLILLKKPKNINKMSLIEQSEIQVKIAQIIERSRHSEERFLIDSKAAASDILAFLKLNNLIDGLELKKMLNSEN